MVRKVAISYYGGIPRSMAGDFFVDISDLRIHEKNPILWRELDLRFRELKDRIVNEAGVLPLEVYAPIPTEMGIFFGYLFRETTGFRLSVIQGDEIWEIKKEVEGEIEKLPLTVENIPGKDEANDLVVVVDISGKFRMNSWENFVEKNLLDCPKILRFSFLPRISAKDITPLVNAITTQIRQERAQMTGKIHLVMAGPAALAVLLGSRLNTLTPIQLYFHENDQSTYVPMALLVHGD